MTTTSQFGGHELTFTQPGGADNGFIGGGYKINSFFLNENIPIMTTFNKPNTNENADTEQVSGFFENLAVPAGLFYINQRTKNKTNDNVQYFYQQHETATDELFDKLFGLVEFDKKKKRKTRKHLDKSIATKTKTKTKTRKQ